MITNNFDTKKVRPLLLCILDGWGHNESDFGNAIRQASTPVFDRINKEHPATLINASSAYVGLPDGQMGNSEVGHLNIGAGRVVMQDLPKVNTAIADGSFYENKAIKEGMEKARDAGTAYHLLGLLSDGGVHSHIEHIGAFIKMAKRVGLTKVYLHPLMDGRDTPPASGIGYMEQIVSVMKEVGVGQVATVTGRYWTMDRDNRWDRVQKGYNAMVHGKTECSANDPVDAVREAYGRGETDEFIQPTIIEGGALLKDGDVLQVFNFRADRVRQIVSALTEENFSGFDRGGLPKISVYCLTEYASHFGLPVAFDNSAPKNGLGETVSNAGLAQLRTAETEKYAHVTYFFNGGLETPLTGETRRMVPSPSVPTYDLKPEMSAYDVAEGVEAAIRSGKHNLVVVNFANGDMVGHTGFFDASLKAVETVDSCVGQVTRAAHDCGFATIITADHGNIEEMLTPDSKPVTSHTTNPVPFYLLGVDGAKLSGNGGALCDVAPTVLKIMGIPQPAEMTGRPLYL